MKFKNVTAERKHVSEIVKKSLGDTQQIQIFENENTSIIYTVSGKRKHASLSNHVRKIINSEIRYTIQKILKTRIDDVKVIVNTNGIVHICNNVGN